MASICQMSAPRAFSVPIESERRLYLFVFDAFFLTRNRYPLRSKNALARGCLDTYAPPRDLAHQPDRLLDHACGDIEMGAGADPAVHHGEQHAALTQGARDHVIAADGQALSGLKKNQIGFRVCCTSTPTICASPRASARGIGVGLPRAGRHGGRGALSAGRGAKCRPGASSRPAVASSARLRR